MCIRVAIRNRAVCISDPGNWSRLEKNILDTERRGRIFILLFLVSVSQFEIYGFENDFFFRLYLFDVFGWCDSFYLQSKNFAFSSLISLRRSESLQFFTVLLNEFVEWMKQDAWDRRVKEYGFIYQSLKNRTIFFFFRFVSTLVVGNWVR